MNQGKRRLNQSLRFVRAVPLNLRDCADLRRGLEQFAVDASPPLFIAVSVATCVVSTMTMTLTSAPSRNVLWQECDLTSPEKAIARTK